MRMPHEQDPENRRERKKNEKKKKRAGEDGENNRVWVNERGATCVISRAFLRCGLQRGELPFFGYFCSLVEHCGCGE